MCRREFFKFGKRDVTFIREMRVVPLPHYVIVYPELPPDHSVLASLCNV